MISSLGAPRKQHRPVLALALGSLVLLAWLVLAVWGASPHARLLDHDYASERVLGGEPLLVLAMIFGWVVMIEAMMLPTSMPLVLMFRRLVRQRRRRRQLVALLLGGYVGLWSAFGVLVHLADLALHAVADQNDAVSAYGWMFGAVTLALAGLYQFSPLKYYCLDKCRSPMSFIAEHWRGRRERWDAFSLGVHHGLFCLGCCWALMLLMFALGMGNLGWMFVLGALMALEKNLPGGRQLSAPLGVGLLLWAALVTVHGWGAQA